MWVPVEAETWLPVVLVASGDRPHAKARIVTRSCKYWIVELDEILNRLTGILIAHSEGQREVWSNFPLVLTIEVKVVPVEVQNTSHTRQVSVDLHVRHIVHEVIQIGVNEVSTRGWFEQLVQLAAMDIDAKLPCVITSRVRQVVLNLVRVSEGGLRQIRCQADRRARGAGIESRSFPGQ